MGYTTIGHKLRVFISSKCGGKYSIARKALKTLLEATGLIEVYAFESEPAGSQDTVSSYLNYVDEADLCLFLVDNYDGVPEPVLKEEKRAKAKSLRLIYIFCDENEKRPTPMQQEIKTGLTQKYFTVHEFSDVVSKAYESIMQDLISVYKVKSPVEVQVNEEHSQDLPMIAKSTYRLNKEKLTRFKKTRNALAKIFDYVDFDDNTAATDLDEYAMQHLFFITGQRQYNHEQFVKLYQEIIKDQEQGLSKLLNCRFEAADLYYQGKHKECIEKLRSSLKEAVENEEVPNWLANDVAIDLRHVQCLVEDSENQMMVEKDSQKFIDASVENVYYPCLDRIVESFYEQISNDYFKYLNTAPYTTYYGGSSLLFTRIADAYVISLMHGSILHTELVRERMVAALQMLLSYYGDHDLYVELIRLLVLTRKRKKLDTALRTYNQFEDIVNDSDVASILSSIENTANGYRKTQCKLLLVSRFGYYMNDDTYCTTSSELVNYSMDWVTRKSREIVVGDYIFDFYKRNTCRLENDQIIDFVTLIFKQQLKRFYDDCYELIHVIDFSKVSVQNQENLMQHFIGTIVSQDDTLIFHYYKSAIIQFACTSAVDKTMLNECLRKYNPDFYNGDYMRIALSQGETDSNIKHFLSVANDDNQKRGKDGSYSVGQREPHEIICDILRNKECCLCDEILADLIISITETLSNERQTVTAKIASLQLLSYLYLHYPDYQEWGRIEQDLINNKENYIQGHEMGVLEKNSTHILLFVYELLAGFLDKQYEELATSKLFSTSQDDGFSAIMYLKTIHCCLDLGVKRKLEPTLLSALCYYCISMTNHKERDVRFNAVKGLICLTHFPEICNLALKQLSKTMDSGSYEIKTAIVARVSKMNDSDDEYIEYILKKAKVDNNFLVRYVANK